MNISIIDFHQIAHSLHDFITLGHSLAQIKIRALVPSYHLLFHFPPLQKSSLNQVYMALYFVILSAYGTVQTPFVSRQNTIVPLTIWLENITIELGMAQLWYLDILEPGFVNSLMYAREI